MGWGCLLCSIKLVWEKLVVFNTGLPRSPQTSPSSQQTGREWRLTIRSLSVLELVHITSTHIPLARALWHGHSLVQKGLGNVTYPHAQDKEGPGFVEHIAVSVTLPKIINPSVLLVNSSVRKSYFFSFEGKEWILFLFVLASKDFLRSPWISLRILDCSSNYYLPHPEVQFCLACVLFVLTHLPL